MALSVRAYRAYAIECSKAVSPGMIQVLELDVNAGANTDVSWDLSTAGGTLWTAALADVTYGATAALALAALKAIAGSARKLLDDHVGTGLYRDRVRLAAATGANDFSAAYNSALKAMEYTFNAASAPTGTTTVTFMFAMGEGWIPINV